MKNHNKTALITGATSGIGLIIAEHLVQEGYTLIILGRSKEKMNNLVQKLEKQHEDCRTEQIICDLSSFRSTIDACKQVKDKFDKLDLLVLNAGLWNFKFKETEDGIEEIFQVNLLSPVLIFEQLHHLLPTDGNSKVVFTSSGLHQGKINFSDLEFREKFSGFKAYRQSKLGLILISRLFAESKEFSGISFFTVHPGMVNTKLGRNANWFARFIFKLFGKSKKKGAETHLYLIDQPNKNLSSGAYYANKKVTKTTTVSYDLDVAKNLYATIQEYLDNATKAD